jgi:regulatory protein
MARVTKIVVQKNNRERASLYVNDTFFCGISLDDVSRFNLFTGAEIAEDDLQQMAQKTNENDFFTKCLAYILKSPRTKLEIVRYLMKKDCPRDVSARVISRLESLNYINDTAYAQSFVAAKSSKVSARMISLKLQNKGVARETVATETREIGEQGDLATAVAAKYMRNKTADPKTLSSLFRYLLGRGFEYDTICDIINRQKNLTEVI